MKALYCAASWLGKTCTSKMKPVLQPSAAGMTVRLEDMDHTQGQLADPQHPQATMVLLALKAPPQEVPGRMPL